MDEVHDEAVTGIWPAFGDLMACVLGAFVLILAGALVTQLDLAERLDAETRQREAAAKRLQSLEQLLAAPLAGGLVTVVDGRIGIAGSLLFAPGSDELHPDGRRLLQQLAGPLRRYLQERDEVLMVSGFTDDRGVRDGSRRYADNLELSALRALTVTRSLFEQGLPQDAVFAAAFGAQRPVASNADAAGRARNRRVEIAPLPRPR